MAAFHMKQGKYQKQKPGGVSKNAALENVLNFTEKRIRWKERPQ